MRKPRARFWASGPARCARRPTVASGGSPRWTLSGVRNTNRARGAVSIDMERDRKRRIDPATAERLLTGEVVGPSYLSTLLAAASRPAAAADPHREDAAVAAFVAVRDTPS